MRQAAPPTMSAPPPLPDDVEMVDAEAFDSDVLAGSGRRRRLALAGVGALVVVATVVGVRASRHVEPAPAPDLVTAAPAASSPPPPAAPAPPVEIGLDPAGAPKPLPNAHAAPTAAERPRAEPHRHGLRHEREQHPRAALARPRAKGTTEGDSDAARAAQRGNDLLLEGNAAGAVAAYQEAIHLAPSDPIGYRGLGLAYEKQGNVDAAVRALVSYLKLSRNARDRDLIARRLYRLTHPEGSVP